MKKLFIVTSVLFASYFVAIAAENRPNILFISVDDMNADSIGAFGCKLPATTPHIDKLAAEGLRFQYAHVVVGNCMPSRNVMFSGRYPHNNRVEGFYQVPDKDYPVLADLMKANGYFTAIRGKVSHSTPFHPYEWDLVIGDASTTREHPKDVQSYYRSTKAGIAAARKAGKPFCLLINISDPHKPFWSIGKKNEKFADPYTPTRIFAAKEVPVPGFLFDDPEIREELALYYSTVRRADDCVGATLKALKESGSEEQTVIVFLSDHGMPLPFAKTAVWHHSTHTPLIIKWPGITEPDTVDSEHMVSAVDLLPTLLDIIQASQPKGIDGRSFAPLIRGQKQSGRDYVFKEYNENSGAGRHPMRGVQSKKYLYIFNPWSDGKNTFKTATTGTVSYRRMKLLAQSDKTVAHRLQLFNFRVLEEFYDVAKDPDCLTNLIASSSHQSALNRHREILGNWLTKTGDHTAEIFRQRDDPTILAAYMTRVQNEATERRKLKARKGQPSRTRGAQLISLDLSKVTKDRVLLVKISHKLPARLGKQKLHITLKGGKGLKRIERKIITAAGDGTVTVEFRLPNNVPDNTFGIAAFVGKDYPNNLQHIATKATQLK